MYMQSNVEDGIELYTTHPKTM